MNASRWIFLCACAILAAMFALKRDIRYSREYMGDLRNRIVGARIIKDGGSPYFYKWKPGDPLRYYDPQAFDIYTPSISTSTPFLHRLLIPLSGLPFATIMRVWMVVLWVIYFAMAGYAFALARAPSARAAVLAVSLLFLLTNAWELQAKYGQTYLLIPALAMLVYALRRWPLAAALAAAALIMVRPNTVLFFLPIVLARRFRWQWLLPVLIVFWAVNEGSDPDLWNDYKAMVKEQIRIHQATGAATRPAVSDPGYQQWEGIDMDTVRARQGRDPVRIYSENGNVFVLYRKVIGRPMPLTLLWALGLLTILLVSTALIVRRRYGEIEGGKLAITGYCLYMISDLFSPIYRHAYYGVQWIMPLLLAASLFPGVIQPRDRTAYGWLLLCLLLNIVHLPFLPMANTIGEYGFLIGLLVIGFRS